MMTQSSSPAAAVTETPSVPKTFWERADDITGFVLFMVIVAGGVVTPFALYAYGLLFR